MWEKLAQMSPRRRSFVKWLLFGLLAGMLLFPRPHLLYQQIRNLSAINKLFQPSMPEMAEINRMIDLRLGENRTVARELAVVQTFVRDHIAFEYDWHNWGNIDYWPDARTVWRRGREDCDGQAVLAVSILRARGYEDATLVGNMNHIWVKAAGFQILGGGEGATLVNRQGRLNLGLPSLGQVLIGAAFVHEFPLWRSLAIYALALVLLYHPCRHRRGALWVALTGLLGVCLFLQWAGPYLYGEVRHATFAGVLGIELIVAAGMLARVMPQLVSPARAVVEDEEADDVVPVGTGDIEVASS